MANVASVLFNVAMRRKVAGKRETSRVLARASRLGAEVDFSYW